MAVRGLRASGKDVLAALKPGGWILIDIEGSHHTLRHPSRGRKVSIPVHGTKTPKRKTLRSILGQADLTEDELKELL